MTSYWKKYLLRHSLYGYARDSLLFFVNLFVWSQERDLRDVAIFNISFLLFHTLMFIITLPLLKRGFGNLLMRIGIVGLGLLLVFILLLSESTVDHLVLLGTLLGISNGLYWFVNHVESFDIANNANRASFFSLRVASQGSVKLAVPLVGWIMFTIFGNNTAGYNAIFAASLLATLAALILTDVRVQKESGVHIRESHREFKKTKFLYLQMLSSFAYGASYRSALATVLLPFLVFQVVETESSLSFIQALFQILAILAALYFARFKKNMDYITRLIVVGGICLTVGILLLIMQLSITTYVLYAILYLIAMSTSTIGLSVMSNNFVSTIKNYKKQRVEYMSLREVFAISGFITGYAFLYFNTDLTIDSLRPLLIFTLLASLLTTILCIIVWKHVQRSTT